VTDAQRGLDVVGMSESDTSDNIFFGNGSKFWGKEKSRKMFCFFVIALGACHQQFQHDDPSSLCASSRTYLDIILRNCVKRNIVYHC
jgi:hypothetical protein